MNTDLILMIAAVIFLILAAFQNKVGIATDLHLGWVGMALWALTLLV